MQSLAGQLLSSLVKWVLSSNLGHSSLPFSLTVFLTFSVLSVLLAFLLDFLEECTQADTSDLFYFMHRPTFLLLCFFSGSNTHRV